MNKTEGRGLQIETGLESFGVVEGPSGKGERQGQARKGQEDRKWGGGGKVNIRTPVVRNFTNER